MPKPSSTTHPEKAKRVPTPKQQKFAKVLAQTGNASEAYRQAYNAMNMSSRTLHGKAYDLTQIPYVIDLVRAEKNRINEKMDKEVVVDRAMITGMLMAASDLAHTGQQAGAAVQAAQVLAKLHGLIVEKSENLNRNEQELSEAQLQAIASRAVDEQDQRIVAHEVLTSPTPGSKAEH